MCVHTLKLGTYSYVQYTETQIKGVLGYSACNVGKETGPGRDGA